MSKITNDGLTRSGIGCFTAVYIRQEWLYAIFLACRSFAACQKLTYLHGNVEFCQRDRLGDYMIASCFAETRRMVMFYLRMHCIITLAYVLMCILRMECSSRYR